MIFGCEWMVGYVLCVHSGSHDHCMGRVAEGCCEDAEAADEECDSGVCIH